MKPIIHIPGTYVDFVQHCIVCGVVLCDDRNMISPEGEKIPTRGWEPGEYVTVKGNGSWSGADPAGVLCNTKDQAIL